MTSVLKPTHTGLTSGKSPLDHKITVTIWSVDSIYFTPIIPGFKPAYTTDSEADTLSTRPQSLDQGYGRGGTPFFTGVFEPLARVALYPTDEDGLGTCFGAA